EAFGEFTAERCKDLILKAIGQEIPVEIVDIAPWRATERVADQFQQGRVFLVGDAAHTMPPYKGLGVNTAIQSAQNLAWKLAAVLGERQVRSCWPPIRRSGIPSDGSPPSSS